MKHKLIKMEMEERLAREDADPCGEEPPLSSLFGAIRTLEDDAMAIHSEVFAADEEDRHHISSLLSSTADNAVEILPATSDQSVLRDTQNELYRLEADNAVLRQRLSMATHTRDNLIEVHLHIFIMWLTFTVNIK